MVARVSNKGQITLPATVRRRLGIAPNSQVEVIPSDHEVTIRPLKSVREVAGILHHLVPPGGSEDWDTVRARMEKAVAEEVMGAHTRRVRSRR